MANGSYDFRGAEATLSGAVRLEAGGLVLSGPGWSVRLDPLSTTDKVQWDWSQRRPAIPTAAEEAAYDALRDRVRGSGAIASVQVTGPLRTSKGEKHLHVRLVR
ncbi:MAG: hypothetical protein JOY90_32935 [Bradyrhizobium sp.]|nr:hypothetical protein [Bradyrhizobium sp.]